MANSKHNFRIISLQKKKEFYTDSHSHPEVGDIGKWRLFRNSVTRSVLPAHAISQVPDFKNNNDSYIDDDRMTSNIRQSLSLKPNKDSSSSLENGWSGRWNRWNGWNTSQILAVKQFTGPKFSTLEIALAFSPLRGFHPLSSQTQSGWKIKIDKSRDVKQRMRHQGSKLSILSHEDLATLYGLVEIVPNRWKTKFFFF